MDSETTETQPLVGFRAWRYLARELTGAMNQDYIWQPGINKASCGLPGYGSCPHPQHHCGLNAFFQPEPIPYLGIKGAILGAGKVQIHETGFRAEQAQIIGFCFDEHNPQDPLAERLQEKFGVPVFYSSEELVEHSRDHGIYVPDLDQTASHPLDGWQVIATKPDSVDDQPSVHIDTGVSDVFIWYQNGKRHRDFDRPAFVERAKPGEFLSDYDIGVSEQMPTQVELWYSEGKIHRDGDRPAEIYNNGGRIWRKNGLRHREGDQPAHIRSNGKRLWIKNGLLHRDGDQPARISKSGNKGWYREGVLHRAGGLPAIVNARGSQEWWINGVRQRSEQRRKPPLPSWEKSDG